ncbi:hypothetical protein [Salipiger bermudensis]|uniref:Uncharacterized protein n=1 Tax=Salipiger bermudensis (strain DSM 26914 / JCM 13377 / KCTC 12554 / HTCC2601) TaxID=314265 RepID=Q0FLL2_SALBH|nr:hypothetical protein [Salipiger bermudensis]EAU45086.1 hypothetical protein R2601_22906 [Salipiger bermudensis HTCC2601]
MTPSNDNRPLLPPDFARPDPVSRAADLQGASPWPGPVWLVGAALVAGLVAIGLAQGLS